MLSIQDEMMCSKIPYSNYSAVATAVRTMLNAAGFKKALIYSNECSTPLVETGRVFSVPDKLPPELDMFSLDLYFGRCISKRVPPPAKASCRTYNKDPMMEVKAVKKFVDAHIRPRLHPHQSVLLVPGLFGDRQTNRSGSMDDQETFLIDKLNGYYSWAKTDPDVAGLIPWHWLSPPPTYGIYPTIFGLGIEAFPKLIARLNEIGKEIRDSNQRQAVTVVRKTDDGNDRSLKSALPAPLHSETSQWAAAQAEPVEPVAAPAGPALQQTVTVQFNGTTEMRTNPERGFRHELDDFCAWSDTHGRWHADVNGGHQLRRLVQAGPNNLSVVQAYCYLDGESDAIPPALIRTLDRGFGRLRAAGVKALFRFAYDHCPADDRGEGNYTVARVLKHIAQLGPAMQRNADAVYVLQAGFVGCWGEWHSSRAWREHRQLEGNSSDVARIVAAGLAHLIPPDRKMMLRYPWDKCCGRDSAGGALRSTTSAAQGLEWGTVDASTAHSAKAFARIGFDDDGFMCCGPSSGDGGTWDTSLYGSPKYLAEDGFTVGRGWDYERVESPYLPMDGEMYWNEGLNGTGTAQQGGVDGHAVAHRLFLHHYTTLSLVHGYTKLDGLASRPGSSESIDRWMETPLDIDFVREWGLPLSDAFFTTRQAQPTASCAAVRAAVPPSGRLVCSKGVDTNGTEAEQRQKCLRNGCCFDPVHAPGPHPWCFLPEIPAGVVPTKPGYTVYQYIRDHLGYRIELQSAAYPATTTITADGEVSFNVSIVLKNYGFSIPQNRRQPTLVLLRSAVSDAEGDSPIVLEAAVGVDPRLWQPRAIGDPFSRVVLHDFTATVRGQVAPGGYGLGLYFPDDRQPLQARADYAIRVANEGVPWAVWGSNEGGVNVLGRVQLRAPQAIAPMKSDGGSDGPSPRVAAAALLGDTTTATDALKTDDIQPQLQPQQPQPQPTTTTTDEDAAPTYADDLAAQCWLNDTTTSCPNPLHGLPRLPKPHYSWPFNDATANISKSPVLRDYARITQSVPVDVNFRLYGKPSCQPSPGFEWAIIEAVRLCAVVNCSLTANYSPFRACEAGCKVFGCCRAAYTPAAQATRTCPLVNSSTVDNDTAACDVMNGSIPNFKWEVGCYKSIITLAETYLQAANKELRSDVRFGAVLLDQEFFGVAYSIDQTPWGAESYQLAMTDVGIKMVTDANDAAYNATLEVWPDVAIDQYKRGEISRSSGDCVAPACAAFWDTNQHGVWCGMPNSGEGNEDVVPCTNTEYSLLDRGQSYSVELYTVGELQAMRETFNKTVNHARSRGVKLVTPWVWLGGGSRRIVASFAGRYNDERWNYQLIDSWMLGLEINNEIYGRHPDAFAQWNYAERVAFYPSMFGEAAVQRTPCGNCNVRLQHFIAYVHGAANQTVLAGPEPGSNSVLHACECVIDGQRILARDA
jgi:hypothetical protein